MVTGSNIRSAYLFSFHAVVIPSVLTVYTGPAGFTTIVKTIALYNEGGAAALGGWVLVPAGQSNGVWLRRNNAVGAQTEDFWQTWFVVEPSDQLQVVSNGGTLSAIGFGAVLSQAP